MTLWMEVTKDKYHYPIRTADSRIKLAELCGVTPNYISSYMWHQRRGRLSERFVKVEI